MGQLSPSALQLSTFMTLFPLSPIVRCHLRVLLFPSPNALPPNLTSSIYYKPKPLFLYIMERKEGKILDCIEIILADKIVWSADKGIPPSPFLPRVLIVPRQICPLIIHPHSPGVSAAVPISRTVSIIVRKLKLVSNL